MPWIPLYADQRDFQWLTSWLNDEPDIAWIVSDGRKRWKALNAIEAGNQGRYCLWHAPSGALPLLTQHAARLPRWTLLARPLQAQFVSNPWQGWKEKMTGADRSQPFFGAGHPGVFWLNMRPLGTVGSGSIGLSSFEWIGNRYRVLGDGANPTTEKWWRRLRRQIAKRAVRIPREGSTDGPKTEIWALPSAFQSIRNGTLRELNPM